ncbi:uncharacterized protein DNG_00597 [Cephalotrichum gorgonifer]|uniref:Uncharacterized protein n=1 Tax=Cephalotrichum gorgonifer TaxID=2041049 RepID=A0AAE8MPE7_9PEZI|nr:uncharacterized protein DNG_00597 [Cephalotrichum gorgonifer]
MPPQSQILVDPFLDMDMSLFQPDGLGGLGLHGAGHGAQDDIELSKGSIHHIFEAIGTFIFSNNGSTPQPSPGPGAETPLPGGPAPATTNESKAWPNANCPCLSIAYMALESLNNMPADLPVAINVTRNAAKTAHDLIQCPICSAPLVDNPLARPPIQSPQNMFLLSALLLSLANAYTRILEIVDTTTAEAKAGARELHFSFCELGGVWRQLDVTRGGSCMLSRGLYEADLPPELWRLAMRAVIRFEIYGLSQKDNAGTDARHPPQQQDNHPGLASALRGVEERSLKRHMKLDELVEKGHEPQDCDTPHVFLKDLKEGEKPQCMWLVEGARIALDKLTIT